MHERDLRVWRLFENLPATERTSSLDVREILASDEARRTQADIAAAIAAIEECRTENVRARC